MRWGRVALIAIPLVAAAALFLFLTPPSASDGVSITLPPPGADDGGPLPPITAARTANAPLVVIDAGHGGRDPGATSVLGGVAESRVTLALATAIRDALASTGRVRVALTRDADSYIALEDRYAIARRLGADLFISVHADIAPSNDQARGATIYTLSEVASDREAATLAQRENEANRLGAARMSSDPNVNFILIDLAQRESMNRAADFARLLHREASPIFPFRPLWHRFAAFIVLKAPDIPSVLLEAGYLSNAQDAAYLQSPAGRARVAHGMRQAIEAYFVQRIAGRTN
jgi:N-acetylmuramoyl-L-alanine amidase